MTRCAQCYFEFCISLPPLQYAASPHRSFGSPEYICQTSIMDTKHLAFCVLRCLHTVLFRLSRLCNHPDIRMASSGPSTPCCDASEVALCVSEIQNHPAVYFLGTRKTLNANILLGNLRRHAFHFPAGNSGSSS